MRYQGELFSLAASISWSVAVILFRRVGEHVPPIALNLFKGVAASALFAVTSMALGDPLLRAVPSRDYGLLLASGAIGFGICDQLFFMCLNRVGAGLNAIITTSYSPFVILFSFLWLGERLSATQLVGVSLIMGAVLLIAWLPETERAPDASGEHKAQRIGIPRRRVIAGVIYGLLAMVTQAISIVMVKPLLEVTPLFWANLWRLIGGVGASLLLVSLVRSQRESAKTALVPANWKLMFPGTLVGTYLALALWLAGMKYTQASISAVLNQTATLWTFVLALIWLKEPVNAGRLLGLALGAIGVTLVTIG